MGRQANPVVGKHFTRGNKIDDASNRYQWNCKQCGEHFPKGRIDTLYNHLTAQCPALSLQEKTSVTLQIHELNLAANAANSVKKKARSENANKASATSPAPDERDFSALNVLAEASHQVVATQYGYPPSFTTGDDPGSQSMVLDPALEDGTFSGTSFCGVVAARPSGENVFSSSGTTSAGVPMAHNPFLHSIDTSMTTMHHGNVPHHSATSNTQATSLSSIAASANATLAHSMVPNLSLPLQETRYLSSSLPVAPSAVNQQAPTWAPIVTGVNESTNNVQADTLLGRPIAASFSRPIAMNPHIRVNDLPVDSSQETSTQKQKVRGKFDDARKEEIKKMRKIGSCIRCKMLKKPCSSTTPCVTCGAIDSPRTWKGFPCLRSKLVDLYQGYMLCLPQKISSQKINTAMSGLSFVPSSSMLLAQSFGGAEPFVFSTLEGATNNSAIDPTLSMLSSGQRFVTKTIILDKEANDLPAIFEKHIQKEAAHFIEHEASPIIKSVARLIHQHSQDSGDLLLRAVMELWMLTTMLSDNTVEWKFSTLRNAPQAAAHSPADVRPDQKSYDLIYSQLQCGLGRLAANLSTHAINTFERRLLRPVSLNKFETFLLGILLINCIERHSWVFHGWTDDSIASSWPLEESPAALIVQAKMVTNVMAFMIKIRNLTSKITEDAAGGILQAEHPDNEKYARWFEEVGVTVDFLTQRQEAVFDGRDGRSLDLKYSATLLLPT